jgi:hypothetical protein
VLRAAFPSDGRQIRAWLRDPDGPVNVLSFWPGGASGQAGTPVRRVRRRA